MTTTRQRLGLDGEGDAVRNETAQMVSREWGGGDHTTPRVDYLKFGNNKYYLGDLRKADFDTLHDPQCTVRSIWEWACLVSDALRGFSDSSPGSGSSGSDPWGSESTSSALGIEVTAYYDSAYVEGLGVSLFRVGENGSYTSEFANMSMITPLSSVTTQELDSFIDNNTVTPETLEYTDYYGTCNFTLDSNCVYLIKQGSSSSTGPSTPFNSILIDATQTLSGGYYLTWGDDSSSI